MGNENGYCKYCGADFDGGDIREYFLTQGKTPNEADDIAAQYGYGPGRTQFGRQIGIYDLSLDRNVNVKCPDCGELQWKK